MTLKGDAQKKMDAFLRSVLRVEKAMKGIHARLTGTSSAMGSFDRHIKTAANDVTRLTTRVNTLSRSMNSLAIASTRAGAAGGGVGGGGRRGGGHGFGAGFLGARLIPHLAAGSIGYGAYSAVHSAWEQGAEYNRGVSQLQAMGYSAQNISMAKNLTGTPQRGMAPTTQMEAFIAAAMATQDPKRAAKLMPVLAQGMLSSKRIFGGMSKHQIEDAIRSAEMMGGGNEDLIAERLSDVFKMAALSGGTVLPSQMRQLVNRNPNLTGQGLAALEPVIQELGGNRVGTGLRSGLAQFVKGQMTRPVAQTLQSYGLLQNVKYDSLGRPIGSKFGDLKPQYFKQLTEDPFSFLKTVRGIYAKKGITGQQDINQHLYFDFQRTFADILVSLNKNFDKSNRILENFKNVPGISGLSRMGSPESIASQRLGESWKSFSLAFSAFSNPAVISGMNLLADILDKMAAFMNRSAAAPAAGSRYLMLSGGLETGHALGSPINLFDHPAKKTNGGGIGDVYLDGKKVGAHVAKGMIGNPMVSNGYTGGNVGLAGAPNTWNNQGGSMSQ